MNDSHDKPASTNYQALWFIIYFGILLQVFRVVLQHYLKTDRLLFGQFFLLGIPSALISVIIERFTRHGNLIFKIFVIMILLVLMLIVNLGVRSIRNPL